MSGAPKCVRCNKSVYQAEEVLAAGKKFHQECFRCKDCGTRLNSTTLCDKGDDIFCTACYQKAFGPKGFGIGGLGVHTGMSVADSGSCGACGAKGQTNKFCGECGKPTQSGRTSPSPSTVSATSAPSASPPIKPSAIKSSTPAPAVLSLGGGDKCSHCNKTVYAAERIQAAGRLFHDTCLRCSTCGHGVNSTNMNDKNGKLYCQPCYGKEYGPKGYGFAGGAAGLMSQ